MEPTQQVNRSDESEDEQEQTAQVDNSKPKRPTPILAPTFVKTPLGELNIEQQKEVLLYKIAKGKVGDVEAHFSKSDELFDFVIKAMSTNKHSKRASELVVKYKKDPKRYPELLQRLQKKAVRYVVQDQPWSMVELRFRSQPDLSTLSAEEYFFKGQKEIALAVVQRNNLGPLLTKQDLKAWLLSEEAAAYMKKGLIPNEVEALDYFGPYKGDQGPVSETKTSKPCVTLQQIGYSEDSIVHVRNSKELDDMMAEILKHKRVGIDIETTPVVIKFADHEPSLLQLAVPGKIFLADFLASPEFGKELFQAFVEQICANDTLLKIGQGLDNDIKTLKKKFAITSKLVSEVC